MDVLPRAFRFAPEEFPFSPATRKVLEVVRQRQLAVRVRAFVRQPEVDWTEPGRDERIRVAMAGLLAAARTRAPSIAIQVLDPRGPEARRSGVFENGVFVLEAGARQARIYPGDLEVVIQEAPLHGPFGPAGRPRGVHRRPRTIPAFRGEEALASALAELLEGGERWVCFTSGHGEVDPSAEGAAGYTRASEALGRLGRRVRRLEGGLAEPAPASCEVVLTVGPREELGEAAREGLGRHLEKGRPYGLLVDAGAPAEGIRGELRPYGLELLDNTLVEPHAAYRSPTDPAVTLPDVNMHFITAPLLEQRQMVGLHAVRGIRYGDLAQEAADVRTLLQTSRHSWGEVDPRGAPQKDELDLWAPVSAAVAVSTVLGANDALFLKEPGELRVAVVGDSRFASNAGLEQGTGNLRFFLRAVRWLSREPPRVRVPPRSLEQLLH